MGQMSEEEVKPTLTETGVGCFLGKKSNGGGNKKVDFNSTELKIHTEKIARKNLDLILHAKKRHYGILRRKKKDKNSIQERLSCPGVISTCS